MAYRYFGKSSDIAGWTSSDISLTRWRWSLLALSSNCVDSNRGEDHDKKGGELHGGRRLWMDLTKVGKQEDYVVERRRFGVE